MTEKVHRAVIIGGICSISYPALYFTRNILSAVSLQIIEWNVLTTEAVGRLSSAYFITYAMGQLINAAIGDKIKAKFMISVGLAMTDVCNLLFSLFASEPPAPYIAYGMTGSSSQ